MKKNFIFHLLLIFTHILPAVFVPALVFSQNTFIVNSLGDNPDLLAGDGVCLDATGSCSLRAAIEEANALPGRDSIAFAIAGAGPFTIAPSSTLPSIAEPLVLDASTQAGYSPGNPQIVLDGGGSLSTALLIQADNCVVRGFCMGNFQMGIRLLGSNNRIEANFIGLAADGNTAFPNVQHGVFITPGNSGNVIGGQSASQRNVISGNGGAGISITDGSNTLIAANYLGTNKDGSAAVPNANGVFIFSSGGSPSGHLLGGSGPGAGNLISGNAVSGIQIVGGDSIAIQGNFIGTNAAGDQAIANGSYGINFFSFGIERITIGGSAPGAGNLISGNGQIGIFIQGLNHQVQGNLIGTQADGLSPLPNGEAGIQVEGALGVTIGGSAPNTIAHHPMEGIRLQTGVIPTNGVHISQNSIFGNGTIGIDLGYNGAEQGPTPNDATDSDAGTNDLQNFADMLGPSFDPFSNTLTLTYSVPSDPANVSYPLTVEFFIADANGQGRTFIGSDTYTLTDYNLPASEKVFSFTPLAPMNVGDVIANTVTDANGNTSEFNSEVVLAAAQVFLRASKLARGIQLHWQPNEQPPLEYELQRADSDGPYLPLASFTPGQPEYRFLDAHPLPSSNRYRLRLRYADGSSRFSSAVELWWTDQTALQLYPNPASGRMFVRHAGSEKLWLRLSSPQGKLLLVQEVLPGGTNISMLPAGLYLAEIRNEQGQVLKVEKLLIR